MGVYDWSRNPDDNGWIDPLIPAAEGASARDYQRGKRGIMAAVRRMADDQGGALASTGTADSFVVRDYSGTTELHAGVSFAFTPNRDNTGPASLVFNSLGSFPLLDRNGLDLAPGALKEGRLVRVIYDEKSAAWRTTDIGVVSNADFAAGPEGTIKGSDSTGLADLTVDAVRRLLNVDRLPNKSEAEMLVEGPIADAFADVDVDLGTKATPKDIADAIAPVIISVAGKATPADISAAVGPLGTSIAALQTVTAPLPGKVATLEANQRNKLVTRSTFADVAALTLASDTTYAVPDSDTGTHAGIASELGYVSGQVPNSGQFAAIGPAGGPLVLRRVADTGSAAIPGLISDRDILRATRYVSRPGELMGGWTDAIAATAALATPITAGPIFGLGDGIGGLGMKVTGTRSAGPIAPVRIDSDKIYSFLMIGQRLVDDPASNVVLPRVRMFDNKGVDLGQLAIPSRTVLATDPLMVIPVTISTRAGAALLQFPNPAGGYIRPYLVLGGTTGVFLINAITQPSESLDLAGSISSSTAKTTLADNDLLAGLTAADGKSASISFLNLKKQIEAAMAGPKTYNWTAHKQIGNKSTVVIPDDDGLIEFGLINTGDFNAVAATGGQQASMTGLGVLPLDAGGNCGTNLMPRGAISVVAENVTRITAFFKTTTAYNVSSVAASQYYIDKISSLGVTLTSAQATLLRTYYAGLLDCGKLAASGGYYNLLAPGAARYLNLADLDGPMAEMHGFMTPTDWRPMVFDGVDDYLNTKRRWKNFATPSDYSMSIYPSDGTIQGASRLGACDDRRGLLPNRSATTCSVRVGGASPVTVAGVSAGAGLVSMSQIEEGKFTIRQRKSAVVETSAATVNGFSDLDILIGARNGALSSTAEALPATSTFYLGPLAMVCFGAHDTATMHNAVSDIQDTFIAGAAAF